MSFDSLMSGREKANLNVYRNSHKKRREMIIPPGVIVFDEGDGSVYIGNGVTVGGLRIGVYSVVIPTHMTDWPPVIEGIGEVGSKLAVVDVGSWRNNPHSFKYQWKRDEISITGATSSEYTLVEADAGCMIECAVTAVNNIGNSLPVSSNEIEVSTMES